MHDFDTERGHWRIGPTPPSDNDDRWAKERPIMVSVTSGAFHFQEHMSVARAEMIVDALAFELHRTE